MNLEREHHTNLTPSSRYIEYFMANPIERIRIIRNGVSENQVKTLATDLCVTEVELFELLGIPRKTIAATVRRTGLLPFLFVEKTIGFMGMLGQVQQMIIESGELDESEAGMFLSRWLMQPLPALGGSTPGHFLDTLEGQRMVSNLLARIQSGAYA